MTNFPKPIVLIILDGWGHSEQAAHNPINTVATPTFDHLLAEYPHTLLNAAGEAVGLPLGQMGNSEVGHLHIGAGRKIPQDLTRINADVQSGKFANNEIFLQAIRQAKAKNKAVHVMGLLSPGGVHSHEKHIQALIELIHNEGVDKNYLHAFLDGRDVPPKSALNSLMHFSDLYKKLGSGQIASTIGRYYAMDRDKRWERTEQAYDLLTDGTHAFHATSAREALEIAYERGETDEFVKPTAIFTKGKQPITIEDGDTVIFMNFRADRTRQLSHAFVDQHFTHFERHHAPTLSAFVTLTDYAKDIPAEVAYAPLTLENTLGEFIATLGLRQLRIAETEKYAHVTYFLNGGQETPFEQEDRFLIPSPKVATYDLQPEMSAVELTDRLVAAIENGQYDIIICNYANPDMVGHTGIESAANEAVSVIDLCMHRVVDSLKKAGGEALITADHGNIETMYDPKTGQPHTAHTNNLVPLIYIGRPATFIQTDGALDDIAPTLIYLMGEKAPQEMTGRCLLALNDRS